MDALSPEPWSFDGALEHAELVPQSENFDGQLAAGPDECEAGQKQGTQEVQHGRRA